MKQRIVKTFGNFLNENIINNEKYNILKSVNMVIDKDTYILYPYINNYIDLENGTPLDDMEDSLFNRLSDYDFGTIDNLIINRNI